MISDVIRSVKMVFILALILCGIYPAMIWGVGRLVFPSQSSGSLLYRDGRIVGSRLIGQTFTRAEYFHSRPSAAGQGGYDAANSSGSNLGPTSQKLADRVAVEVDRVLRANPGLAFGTVPVELVTASGSGLDPHLSTEAAAIQIPRIAQARGMRAERIRALLRENTEGPQFGFLGEPVVNILALNLALDEAQKGQSQ